MFLLLSESLSPARKQTERALRTEILQKGRGEGQGRKEVNRQRTLSGPLIRPPLPVPKQAEEQKQEPVRRAPDPQLSLPSPALLAKSQCQCFSGSSQKRKPQQVKSPLPGVPGMRRRTEKRKEEEENQHY